MPGGFGVSSMKYGVATPFEEVAMSGGPSGPIRVPSVASNGMAGAIFLGLRRGILRIASLMSVQDVYDDYERTILRDLWGLM
jgi:hypothetical protein